MPAPPYDVGAASQAAAALVAAGLAVYTAGTLTVAVRGLRKGLPDRWSTLACAGALAALAWLMLTQGAATVPEPFGTLAAAALAVGLAYPPLYVGFGAQRAVDAARTAVLRLVKTPVPDLPQEERRKVPHVAMGAYVLPYLGLGHAVALLGVAVGPAILSAAAARNAALAAAAPWHEAGIVAGLALLLLLVFVLLPVELVRLAFPATPYPWKRVIEPLLRPREAGLVGGHVHMAVGAALAALVLATRLPGHAAAAATVTVLGVAVFADALSAIVGIRFGRTKWGHNANKSHIGTLAGTLAAFAIAVPFVGWPLAALAAAWFLLVDVAAPVPVPISDNLLNPIGLALLFAALPDLVAPLLHLP